MSVSPLVRDQRGFMLIELLLSLTLAIVLLTGVFGVLRLAMTQSTDSLDRVDSGQSGRSAMQHMAQELHSSCVAPGAVPVLAGSTATSLAFLSQYGSAVSLTPAEHVVALSGATLTDSTYPATGGTAPNWTLAPSPSSQLVLDANASQATINGAVQPVFQYFAYSGGALSTTPLATPLSAADALNTAEVTISFAASPGDRSRTVGRSTVFTNSVVLRFQPASNLAATPDLPCQ